MNKMIVMKVIAGIVGYIIISVTMIILLAYMDRKLGKTSQEIYEENNFNEYCMVGFLFPIALPCLAMAGIYELIKTIGAK